MTNYEVVLAALHGLMPGADRSCPSLSKSTQIEHYKQPDPTEQKPKERGKR